MRCCAGLFMENSISPIWKTCSSHLPVCWCADYAIAPGQPNANGFIEMLKREPRHNDDDW
jgi:hypothetical protein